MLIVGQKKQKILEVPNTISKLFDNDGEGVYLGSSQQISSEVFPLIAMYQW